jgi:hypothetical protein
MSIKTIRPERKENIKIIIKEFSLNIRFLDVARAGLTMRQTKKKCIGSTRKNLVYEGPK